MVKTHLYRQPKSPLIPLYILIFFKYIFLNSLFIPACYMWHWTLTIFDVITTFKMYENKLPNRVALRKGWAVLAILFLSFSEIKRKRRLKLLTPLSNLRGQFNILHKWIPEWQLTSEFVYFFALSKLPFMQGHRIIPLFVFLLLHFQFFLKFLKLSARLNIIWKVSELQIWVQEKGKDPFTQVPIGVFIMEV